MVGQVAGYDWQIETEAIIDIDRLHGRDGAANAMRAARWLKMWQGSYAA